jgi:hypothetical protein
VITAKMGYPIFVPEIVGRRWCGQYTGAAAAPRLPGWHCVGAADHELAADVLD